MIKIREETNKTKINKNNKKKINDTKSCSFKNINKTDKLLSRFTNEREREDTNRQNNKLKRRNNN